MEKWIEREGEKRTDDVHEPTHLTDEPTTFLEYTCHTTDHALWIALAPVESGVGEDGVEFVGKGGWESVGEGACEVCVRVSVCV